MNEHFYSRVFLKIKSIPPWLILSIGLALFGALCLGEVSRNEWIPNAVLAHIADVAGNVAEGRGLQSDAVADYLLKRSAAHHPEDVLAPGLPVVMAMAFRAMGKKPFCAYLPAVIFYLLAGLMTYEMGKHYYGQWVGIIGAYLVWMSVPMTQMALSGLPHTGFILLFSLAMYICERSLSGGRKPFLVAVAGFTAGLAFYMDFKAAALLAAFPVFAMTGKSDDRSSVLSARARLAAVAVFLTVFALTTAPWAVRNRMAFGGFGYPTWGTRVAQRIARPNMLDRPGPIIPFQKLYDENERPSLSNIMGERGAYWLAMVKPRVELYRLIMAFLNYNVLEVGIFLFGLMGLIFSWTSGRKSWVRWNLIVGLSCLLWLFQGGYIYVSFGVFIPSAALFCSYFLFDFGKWVKLNISAGGALVYALALASLFGLTSLVYWHTTMKARPPIKYPRQIASLNDWINRNVKPDEAVITRMPQHVAWGTGRGAVATPMAGWSGVMELAAKYNARYIVIEIPDSMVDALEKSDVETFPVKQLLPLYRGEGAFGAVKAHEVEDAFDVWAIPRIAGARGAGPPPKGEGRP